MNFSVNALAQKVNNYKKVKNHQNFSFGVILGIFPAKLYQNSKRR